MDGQAPARGHPRLGLGDRPVEQVQLRVVAARNPRVAAAPQGQRQVAPGVAPGIAGRGDGQTAPQLLAGGGVVGGDEATVGHEPRASVDAVDDPAVHHDRPARVGIAVVVVGHPGLPDELPGPAVEGHDEGVARPQEQLVAVDGEVAAVRAAQRLGQRAAVLPQQGAGRGVESLDDVAGVGEIHHAVVHEGRRLVAAVPHRPHPGELQVGDVVTGNLVERAVPPSVVGPTVDQPVVRVGVPQHRVGDGHALRDGPEASRAPRRGARRRDGRRRRSGIAPRRRGDAPQGHRPRRHPVLLQDVGDGARVFIRRERAPGARRHRHLHQLDQLVDGTGPPTRRGTSAPPTPAPRTSR